SPTDSKQGLRLLAEGQEILAFGTHRVLLAAGLVVPGAGLVDRTTAGVDEGQHEPVEAITVLLLGPPHRSLDRPHCLVELPGPVVDEPEHRPGVVPVAVEGC